MGKHNKVLLSILSGRSDTNINFSDLRQLILSMGFEERIKGSHHLYRKQDVPAKINLQKDGNKAKPYQVRQVRAIIKEYHLIGAK